MFKAHSDSGLIPVSRKWSAGQPVLHFCFGSRKVSFLRYSTFSTGIIRVNTKKVYKLKLFEKLDTFAYQHALAL